MRVLKLTPDQIAIDLSDKEIKTQIERLISPKLREEGFKITGLEKNNEEWLIMLRRDCAKEKDV